MTAIVGVLNKHAISVAADSAETVGDQHNLNAQVKIYNNANKIFTLSKVHPVGVAIYSNAQFNSLIPWEIIIKLYRKQLKNKCFPFIKDYASDFLGFLDSFRASHINEPAADIIASEELFDIYSSIILSQVTGYDASSGTLDNSSLKPLLHKLNAVKTEALKANKFPSLTSLTIEEFRSSCSLFFQKAKKQIESAGGSFDVFETVITETLFEMRTRDFVKGCSNTGIAFFGYGEDEIFPALHRFEIYNCLAGRLVWKEIEINEISDSKHAIICPMAQTDVMTTYITDISPSLERAFFGLTENTMKNVLNTLRTIVKPVSPEIAKAIGSVDLNPFLRQYADNIAKFKNQNAIAPLMNTVATMEKEDLAELAENLIYLTSLKRRITPNLESVGGPVDVAIVSKGDGFIWIKRKHYFDPALNRCFIDNYMGTNT